MVSAASLWATQSMPSSAAEVSISAGIPLGEGGAVTAVMPHSSLGCHRWTSRDSLRNTGTRKARRIAMKRQRRRRPAAVT
jgi:hypothetical protein